MTYRKTYEKLQSYMDACEWKAALSPEDRKHRAAACCRTAVEDSGCGEHLVLEDSDTDGVFFKVFAMAEEHRVYIGYFEFAGLPKQTVAVRFFGLREYGNVEFKDAVVSMADKEALK